MKENIFTHKILPILSILILVSFIFISNNAFAAEISVNDKTFIIPTGVSNYIIAEGYPHNNSNYYVLLYSDLGTYWKVYGQATEYFTVMCYSDENFKNAVSFNVVYISSTGNDFSQPTSSKSWSGNFAIYNDVIYSTVDIYSKNGTEIFFQKTPVMEIPEIVEIPALETVEQIPETITKTLKLIIPVGLVVLSIFLVIYLTRRLIYRTL